MISGEQCSTKVEEEDNMIEEAQIRTKKRKREGEHIVRKIVSLKNAIDKLTDLQREDTIFLESVNKMIKIIHTNTNPNWEPLQTDNVKNEIEMYQTHTTPKFIGINKKMSNSKKFIRESLIRGASFADLYLFMSSKLKHDTKFMTELENISGNKELDLVCEIVSTKKFNLAKIPYRFWDERRVWLESLKNPYRYYVDEFNKSTFQDIELLRAAADVIPDLVLENDIPESAFIDKEFCLNMICCSVHGILFDRVHDSLKTSLEFAKECILRDNTSIRYYLNEEGAYWLSDKDVDKLIEFLITQTQ